MWRNAVFKSAKWFRGTSGKLMSFTAVALVAATVTGCGGSAPAADATAVWSADVTPDQILADAKSQGEVVVYTSLNEGRQANFDAAFTAKYGIEVKQQRLVAGKLDQKVDAELRAGQNVTDVVMGSNTAAYELWRDQGWLASIPDSALTSIEEWPDAHWNGYWADVLTNFYGIIYNTDLVPADKAPKTWDDLLDPFWTGKLLMIDPANGTSSQLMYNLLLQEKGEEFIEKLGDQGSRIAGGVPGAQAVGSGAALAYFPAVPDTAITAKGAGQPVEIVYPTLSTKTDLEAAVLTGAPHKDAGALYVDFAMSAEGQALINAGGFSVLPGVEGTELVPDTITPPDFTQTEANSDKLIQAIS